MLKLLFHWFHTTLRLHCQNKITKKRRNHVFFFCGITLNERPLKPILQLREDLIEITAFFIHITLCMCQVKGRNLVSCVFNQRCHSGSKSGWTNDNSLSCNDGKACTRNDRCSSGSCIGTPFTCLYCEECYNDACRVKSGYCTIVHGGTKTCFSHGSLRPGYPCQVILNVTLSREAFFSKEIRIFCLLLTMISDL